MKERWRHVRALARLYGIVAVMSVFVGVYEFAMSFDRGEPILWLAYIIVVPLTLAGIGEGMRVLLAIEEHLMTLREGINWAINESMKKKDGGE